MEIQAVQVKFETTGVEVITSDEFELEFSGLSRAKL